MADKLSDDGLSEERIRVRAYEIFIRRGGQGGTPESDWLLAREELIKETSASAAPPSKKGAGKGAVEAAPPAGPRPHVPPPKRSSATSAPTPAAAAAADGSSPGRRQAPRRSCLALGLFSFSFWRLVSAVPA
jgi:hypothetical protein